LRRYELCSYLGTPPGVTLRCVICSNDFQHVLYRLWPIGMAASHLEVITRICRTQITWLWPCDMKSNRGIPLGCLHDIYENKCVLYMYVNIYMYILLSSPYLRVLGDNRVRGTREQMMLMQVVRSGKIK